MAKTYKETLKERLADIKHYDVTCKSMTLACDCCDNCKLRFVTNEESTCILDDYSNFSYSIKGMSDSEIYAIKFVELMLL